MQGKAVRYPAMCEEEFDAYLKCGRLEEGFLRVRCEGCHAEKLVAFSCKKRGFCPSCGGRRMAETAALLADEVLPERPLRQWVLSLPFALRFLLATDADSLTLVLRTVYRAISGFLLKQACVFLVAVAFTRCRARVSRDGGPAFHGMSGHRFTACRATLAGGFQ